ncbi:hypothetical protein [Oceanisphaera ostreae]|uniref:Uncharacterized protein n=1 Tax=Oceanisphaera ostreae TaxID=914151 RepID=A0ABW3KDL3_9GAMM
MVIFSIKRRQDSQMSLFYVQRPYHRSLQYRLRRRRNNLRRTRLWHRRRR